MTIEQYEWYNLPPDEANLLDRLKLTSYSVEMYIYNVSVFYNCAESKAAANVLDFWGQKPSH